MKSIRRFLIFGSAMTLSGTLAIPYGGWNPTGATLLVAQVKREELSAHEKRIRSVLDEMGGERRYLSVSREDGEYLQQITRSMGAQRVVEVGTSTGYSSLWFAIALRATGGKLYTHEIDQERIEMAREHFKRAGVEDIVTLIPGDAHETVRQHRDPIDIVFLDADKQGYIDYLNKLLPLVRPGGVILAHNMRRPRPDPRYLEAITTNPNLETEFVLMDGAGMGVTTKKR